MHVAGLVRAGRRTLLLLLCVGFGLVRPGLLSRGLLASALRLV